MDDPDQQQEEEDDLANRRAYWLAGWCFFIPVLMVLILPFSSAFKGWSFYLGFLLFPGMGLFIIVLTKSEGLQNRVEALLKRFGSDD